MNKSKEKKFIDMVKKEKNGKGLLLSAVLVLVSFSFGVLASMILVVFLVFISQGQFSMVFYAPIAFLAATAFITLISSVTYLPITIKMLKALDFARGDRDKVKRLEENVANLRKQLLKSHDLISSINAKLARATNPEESALKLIEATKPKPRVH